MAKKTFIAGEDLTGKAGYALKVQKHLSASPN